MNPDYNPDPDQKYLVPDFDGDKDDVLVEAVAEDPASDDTVAGPVVDDTVADTTTPEPADAPASTEGN